MNFKKVTCTLALAFFTLVTFSASAQEDIQALANKWSTAYNAFDAEGLGKLYTENAHLYLRGTPMIIGRKPIEEFWAGDFTIDNPLTTLNATDSIMGYDMMLVRGNYEVTGRDSGETLGSGNFTHIWHNVDGQWMLDQDLWN
ncbi:MAG TPA: hypothetical protein DCY55_12105 [Gammaproteobacteria bacterium]|jgi:ketosteroid isomerase-like protein|nr:nuclear transport factor 2 family protein [Pseudomonadota bacterium]HAY47006.1 hypothetical protein [Gammaproteobacteria bacterium]